MFLKEIKVENFKSFGKKVRLPFGPGFTGITGPNGSGKSNISDAILFVLGPKSSKVIRAGKLSDLIFNGGKTGKPAKECKVSLVFDNTDRIIGVDSDEVTLTRLVRRTSSSSATDSNSYFYVNGKKSSLSEFDQLLCHARISADGYNFVQQGDVNRIATMGPVERRRILDTISGITKFDEEISSAEKKKESAIRDIERINVLLDEINQHVLSLDSERTEAAKYVELRETVRTNEAYIVHKRLAGVEEGLAALEEQLSAYSGEKEGLEEEKRRLEASIEEASEIVSKLEDDIRGKGGEEAEDLRKRMDEAKIKRARASDAVEDADDELRLLAADKKRLMAELKKLEGEKIKLEEDHALLASSKKGAEDKLKIIRVELEGLENTASQASTKVEELRKEESSLAEASQNIVEQLGNFEVEAEKKRVELESRKREVAELEDRKKDAEAEIKDAEWESKELRKEHGSGSSKKLQEKFYSKKAEERRLTEESTTLEGAVKRLEREYEKARAHVEMAEKAAMGYSQPVMAVLEARDRGELKGIHGTISELVTADGDYETALSVAGGNRMQSIVVDSDEDAENAINYLRKGKMGRATFLPLNKMLDGRPRGKSVLASRDSESDGFAIDLLNFDERYRPAVWFVFGDTVVVKTLKDARRLMGGVRLVTTQGDLLEASGAMVGGNLPKGGKSFGASRGQLENVGEELRKAREAADTTLNRLQVLRGELSELESDLREASGRDGQIDIRIEALKQRRDTAKKEMSKILQRLSALENEMAGLDKNLEIILQRKIEHEKKIEETKNLLSDVREKLASATPKEVGDRLRNLRDSEKDEMAVISGIQEKLSELSPKLAVVRNNINASQRAMEENSKRAEELKKDKVLKRGESEKHEAEVTALSRLLSSMSAEIEALRQEREKAISRRTDLEKEKEKILVSMENKEDFHIGIKTKAALLEEQRTALLSEWEESGVQIPEKIPSMETLKRKASEAKNAMDAMGAVNLRALEEYDRQKARYDTLSSEMKQVKDEKKALEKLVDTLVARKTEGFMKVFLSVNENFKQVYARLSQGGEAELVLENPEKPFEGGLIISARPPGKKVLRVEALSGGEKSLVSMGFIIAIQQHDPSPFYLLDEVDQNLDAINAENLARLVGEDSRNAQFMMISLRKVTLKEADTLYGVTLERNGLSQVLGTVDLSSMKEPEPTVESAEGQEAEMGV